MKRFSIKSRLLALATVLVVGGSIGTVTASSASAADTCKSAAWGGNAGNEAAMCGSAWKLANLSPLTNRQVIQYGYDWCNIKRIKGTTVANQSLADRIGSTKATAIRKAADSWLC